MNRSNLDSAASSTPIPTAPDLNAELLKLSLPKQLQRISEIAAEGAEGFDCLVQVLKLRQSELASDWPTVADGALYQTLFSAQTAETIDFLSANFPQGIVPLRSKRGVDYSALQQLLAKQELEAADRLTLAKMCELAGETAVARGWLYFTEVEAFPTEDLRTIDQLWLLHSGGRFGFSVQRNLWLGMGQNWDRLWPRIGWKDGNTWTRYPNGFTWDLTAPIGHLPLTNQLRGVRVMAALMNHPAWQE